VAIDTDTDGLIDALDSDSDSDGVLDITEGVFDSDSDGTPDYRDTDDDGDGIPTFTEGVGDADADGTPNYLDSDSDGDGVPDSVEATYDTDGDGTPDYLDTDSDDDSILDRDELDTDSDFDGSANRVDGDDDGDSIPTATEGTADVDNDGIPNYLDLDSDDDGYDDSVEATAGSDPYDPLSTPDSVNNPTIITVSDVGNDQGRRVRVGWTPSNLDAGGSPEPILSYSIYRRIDGNKAAADGIFTHATAPGLWDFVLNLPASGETTYQTLAGTLCDSTDVGVCWSVFFIRAHTAAPTVFYDSLPDSGYSVDNLAPGAPLGFAVAYGADNALNWEPSTDADFRYFRIYRSDAPNFIPQAADLVLTTAATTWIDPGAGFAAHYLISAVDFAGNEGPVSAPLLVSGVDDTPSFNAFLGQNTPNPFNPSTTISFSLAQAEAVSLDVFDISGRHVRRLLAGEVLAPGPHATVWTGRDDAGRSVAAGIYFYSVTTPSFRDTRRMALVK
jgi:hypothetical protein